MRMFCSKGNGGFQDWQLKWKEHLNTKNSFTAALWFSSLCQFNSRILLRIFWLQDWYRSDTSPHCWDCKFQDHKPLWREQSWGSSQFPPLSGGAIRHSHEPSQGPVGASSLPELPETLAKFPPTPQPAAGAAKEFEKSENFLAGLSLRELLLTGSGSWGLSLTSDLEG